MPEEYEPLQRERFDAERLMTHTPPRFHDANKMAVFAKACPPGTTHAGTIAYSRWDAMPLPGEVDPTAAAARVGSSPGYFDYAPNGGDVEWHVNFADPHLFVAYGGQLFAQDEMQVMEHPVLGALRETLASHGLPALTVEAARPTPVLVMGAERRCAVATEPNAAEGRPGGLYGNAFARASTDAVLRATTVLDPPTVTNLIAIAAPRPSYGHYTREQILDGLTTAFTGFRAAVQESEPGSVVVHTGFWGCGAFGGNRVLMVSLQALAAAMAGVDRIVFHTGGADGDGVVARAKEVLASLGARPLAADDLVDRLVELGFEWGVSDGN